MFTRPGSISDASKSSNPRMITIIYVAVSRSPGSLALKSLMNDVMDVYSPKYRNNFSNNTGWWYTYPSEKNMKVSWDDDIPN